MNKFWGWLFALVMGGIFVMTAAAPVCGWWLPRPASSYAPAVDHLFYLIFGITGFFFVLTEAILVYNLFAFAGRPGRRADYVHGSHRLEMTWTVITAFILFFLALYQVNVWADIKYPSRMADRISNGSEEYLQIEVAARQWEYRMRYPSPGRIAAWDQDRAAAVDDFKSRLPEHADDVRVVNDLHVWKDHKVLVHLKTRDVGHSFFLPNVRVKQDALPGRTIPVWFLPTETNCHYDESRGGWVDGVRKDGDEWVADDSYIFDLVCTQYCGSRHSMMRGKLFVHETRDDFLKWLRGAAAEYAPAR